MLQSTSIIPSCLPGKTVVYMGTGMGVRGHRCGYTRAQMNMYVDTDEGVNVDTSKGVHMGTVVSVSSYLVANYFS